MSETQHFKHAGSDGRGVTAPPKGGSTGCFGKHRYVSQHDVLEVYNAMAKLAQTRGGALAPCETGGEGVRIDEMQERTRANQVLSEKVHGHLMATI